MRKVFSRHLILLINVILSRSGFVQWRVACVLGKLCLSEKDTVRIK